MISCPRFIRVFFLGPALLWVAACGKLDSPASSAGVVIPGSSTPLGNQIFNVSVGTIWESDTSNSVTSQGNCTFPDDGIISKSCTLSVPEGQLFFSKLRMDAAVFRSDKCQVFEIHPFYFRMGTTATFSPTWATANFNPIDCSDPKAYSDANCWGGPAATFAPLNFPTNTYLYYPLVFNPSLSWTFDSTNAVRTTRNYTGGIGNRWTVNNVTTGEYNDWEFVCRDLYYDQKYTLKLNLRDVDGVLDDYPTTRP